MPARDGFARSLPRFVLKFVSCAKSTLNGLLVGLQFAGHHRTQSAWRARPVAGRSALPRHEMTSVARGTRLTRCLPAFVLVLGQLTRSSDAAVALVPGLALRLACEPICAHGRPIVASCHSCARVRFQMRRSRARHVRCAGARRALPIELRAAPPRHDVPCATRPAG